jgi:cytidylate kinase
MAQSTEQLVERQMNRWRVLGRTTPTKPSPCIALSRLPGAGAEELGVRVAERLGWGFFGIEIIDQIAREQGIARRLLEGLDERVRSAIERQVVDAMGHPGLRENEYLHLVARAVLTFGERGGCVLLGRGSHLILPPERTLRVLVVAPPERRAESVARQRGVTQAEASTIVSEEDTARREFFRHHFSRDPDDPVLFDLTVNTGSLSRNAATELTLLALRERFPGQRLEL